MKMDPEQFKDRIERYFIVLPCQEGSGPRIAKACGILPHSRGAFTEHVLKPLRLEGWIHFNPTSRKWFMPTPRSGMIVPKTNPRPCRRS